MGRRRSCSALAILAVAVTGLLPARAAARELHWSALAVEARLEGDGSLSVTEEHAMVFDGDWNGGERRFRLGPGQRIELRGITRIDPETGERRALVEGDLTPVDRFAWVDGSTLRWRSRLPSDPPFSAETLIYVLDYRLTGVLLPQGGGVYRLDHDFAFPDRDGRIERFRLDLELDPAFAPLDEVPRRLERRILRPWESMVVTARLRFLGAGRPAGAAPPPAPLALRLALAVAMAAAVAWLFVRFWRRETGAGRLPGALVQPPEIGRAWIEQNLLALPPEDVGALWDRRVGSPEVAAVLARLVAEGKLRSELGGGSGKKGSAAKDDLRLSLLVGRERFRGFERELIDKLFYGDREQVTTEKLRNHYRQSGFDPVAIVRPAIEERLKGRRETAPVGREAPARWPTAALAFALIALLAAERWLSPASGRLGLVLLASILLWTYPLAAVIAGLSRRHVERLGVWSFAFGAPVLALAAGAARTLFLPELAGLTRALSLESPAFLAPGIFGALALALAPVMVGLSVTNVATSREAREAVVLRQRLLQARRYLQSQLRLPDPDLDDAWFPYLLALGLSNDVDRWSVGFGAAGGTTAAAVGALATSGGSASGSGGWTGGGGRFGGAGASGSWAAAATGMAAGVSAPSSSGGGGGGGGGGGSSGGGGGGGW